MTSIDDLKNRPNKTEPWDGVRNYQARNMMSDQMRIGDKVFLPRGHVVYHSNCKEPVIVGIARVSSKPYADITAFDEHNKHYDHKSDCENPRWYLVDVTYVKKFKRTISLAELKQYEDLQDMQLLRKGNRLSVMPVTESHWIFINSLL